MSRGPQTFRQRDLCAAIKAAKAAGCEVARIEVGKDGRIVVILAREQTEDCIGKDSCPTANEWDAILK
jgi:hypothetical protein